MVLNIKCKSPLESTTAMQLQSNSCDNIESCSIGYYRRDEICVPNICKCDHGSPSKSDFNKLSAVCGITAGKDFRTFEGDNDSDETSKRSTRIKGGDSIDKDQIPFQAFLYRHENSERPHCSSGIINPEFLITAAHCVVDLQKVFVTAHVNSAEEKKIGKPIVHELYHTYSQDGKVYAEHDIAMVKLKKDFLHFNTQIRPICLDGGEDEDDEEEEEEDGQDQGLDSLLQEIAVVIGHQDETDVNKVVKLDLKIMDPTECGITDDNKSKYPNVICAGSASDNLGGTCPTDSGSPLIFPSTDDYDGKPITRWGLIGLVSLGSKNCEGKGNTIFTDVRPYKGWIKHRLRSNDFNGQFCAIHDQHSCVSCGEGFVLQGRKCNREFQLSRDLQSLINFHDKNYCSERCLEYINCQNESENNDSEIATSLPQVRNAFPKFKKCFCTHGQPQHVKCLKSCSNNTVRILQ